MTLLVALDLLVAALLLATIGFCIVLNRKLAALRRNETELAQVLVKFNEAAAMAETGIARLKEVGNETTVSLKDRIGEARALRDDLAFVTERGDRMVAELGRKIANARTSPNAAPAAATGTGATVARLKPVPKPALSAAERELLAALEQAR